MIIKISLMMSQTLNPNHMEARKEQKPTHQSHLQIKQENMITNTQKLNFIITHFDLETQNVFPFTIK
jgi:hypothetical protein